jgi:hypothetical protein
MRDHEHHVVFATPSGRTARADPSLHTGCGRRGSRGSICPWPQSPHCGRFPAPEGLKVSMLLGKAVSAARSEDETLTDPANEAAALLTLGRSVSFSLAATCGNADFRRIFLLLTAAFNASRQASSWTSSLWSTQSRLNDCAFARSNNPFGRTS